MNSEPKTRRKSGGGNEKERHSPKYEEDRMNEKLSDLLP